MATGTVKTICGHCGKEFEAFKKFYKREEADKWEEWAKENVTMCPECYAKQKKEEELKRIVDEKSKYAFPELAGRSESQINYALNLRDKYIVDYATKLEKAQKGIENVQANQERIKAIAARTNTTAEDVIIQSVIRSHLYKAYMCLTESNASKLIDVLKQFDFE